MTLCAEQIDETWLAEFQQRIRTKWDFTAIHINKNSIDGVKKVIVSLFVLRLGELEWALM